MRENLRRFAAALPGLSRERSSERRAASPGDERLTRMGAVLAAAVHELCSPLTTMAVLVEELRQRPDAGDCRELAESLRIMSDQIEACRSILSKLSEHGERGASLSGADARALPHHGAETRSELHLSTGV